MREGSLTRAAKAECRIVWLDDDISDISPEKIGFSRDEFKLEICKTLKEWAARAKSADQNTVLISDNRIEGVPNLHDLDRPDIDTDGGTSTGMVLLTQYCELMQIRPGRKILYTAFPLSDSDEAFLSRRKNNGDEISVFYKEDRKDRAGLKKTLHDFRDERVVDLARYRKEKEKRDIVLKKFQYVMDFLADWELSSRETANLFGLASQADPGWSAIEQGTTSSDIEWRCDRLIEMKRNLSGVFAGKSDRETRWLRAKNPRLNGKSPLIYISENPLYRLESLVSIMRGR